jgi:hypothetical protein
MKLARSLNPRATHENTLAMRGSLSRQELGAPQPDWKVPSAARLRLKDEAASLLRDGLPPLHGFGHDPCCQIRQGQQGRVISGPLTPVRLQFGLRFNIVRRRPWRTHSGRWFSLNRRGRRFKSSPRYQGRRPFLEQRKGLWHVVCKPPPSLLPTVAREVSPATLYDCSPAVYTWNGACGQPRDSPGQQG